MRSWKSELFIISAGDRFPLISWTSPLAPFFGIENAGCDRSMTKNICRRVPVAGLASTEEVIETGLLDVMVVNEGRLTDA
jgi:hypothetical protein